MRISLPGVRRSRGSFRFRFDGKEIEAFPGETVAAALINADIWTLRRTRGGAGRGLFCGMGVCGECSVLIDGVQRRACLDVAEPGVDVRTMPARAPAMAVDTATAKEPEKGMEADVLIVGAGPAGLAAAEASAKAGLDVLVVDERRKAGGQYFKQPGDGFAVDGAGLDDQFAEGAELIASAKSAGARFLFGATLWASVGPEELFFSAGGANIPVHAKRIILAPGAFERPHMVPGWTLPGVMTTGAAQTLLRSSQTAPGRRVLIAGNGPLNLQVARELARAGAEVVALAELANPIWRSDPRAGLALAANAPGLAWDGFRHLVGLRRAGVPIHYRHVLIRAEGDDKVRRGVIAKVGEDGAIVAGSERAFDVDSICMGYGFLPQAEIPRALGCEQRLLPDASLVTIRDDDGRTSDERVFLAGDAGGLGGARVAIAQGRIAAAAVARDLGATTDSAQLSNARTSLQRHHRFQRALCKLYEPAAVPANLAECDTLVCRCEEIDRAAVGAAISSGITTPGSVKRASRLGMGRCQGRFCGAALTQLIAEQTNAPVEAGHYFAPRAPFKPISLAAVIGTFKNEQ